MLQTYTLHLNNKPEDPLQEMSIVNQHKSIVFNIFGAFLLRTLRRHSLLNMNKLLILILVTLSMEISAQGGINSPFSRFGIGDLNTEAPMHLRQMGGISTAYIDPQQLNFDNPASLSHLLSTGFDIGLDFKRSKLDDGINQSSQWSGNLGYMALGFPLRNPYNAVFTRETYKFNWGMGFALLPNSTVSYDISRLDSVGTDQVFNRNFDGNGGTYKAIWGNAIKYGDFSLGTSIGWLFGKIQYRRNVDFLSEIAAYDNQFSSSYTMRGFYSKFGLLYNGILNKKEISDNIGREAPKSIVVGLTYKPALGFSTKAEVLDFNFLALNANSSIIDTSFYSGEVLGNGSLPAELAFGVTHGYKYAVGVDFRQTYWSKYRNDANPEQLNNTTRLSLGGYWRPDINSINSIFQRATYRLGVYMEEDPRSIESENISAFGVTMGVGLPLAWQRKFSNVNIGLDIGKRSVTNVLSENFAKITFGFTFNEGDWFRKFYLD